MQQPVFDSRPVYLSPISPCLCFTAQSNKEKKPKEIIKEMESEMPDCLCLNHRKNGFLIKRAWSLIILLKRVFQQRFVRNTLDKVYKLLCKKSFFSVRKTMTLCTKLFYRYTTWLCCCGKVPVWEWKMKAFPQTYICFNAKFLPEVFGFLYFNTSTQLGSNM